MEKSVSSSTKLSVSNVVIKASFKASDRKLLVILKAVWTLYWNINLVEEVTLPTCSCQLRDKNRASPTVGDWMCVICIIYRYEGNSSRRGLSLPAHTTTVSSLSPSPLTSYQERRAVKYLQSYRDFSLKADCQPLSTYINKTRMSYSCERLVLRGFNTGEHL